MVSALPWLLVCVALIVVGARTRDWVVVVLAIVALLAVFAPAVLH